MKGESRIRLWCQQTQLLWTKEFRLSDQDVRFMVAYATNSEFSDTPRSCRVNTLWRDQNSRGTTRCRLGRQWNNFNKLRVYVCLCVFMCFYVFLCFYMCLC